MLQYQTFTGAGNHEELDQNKINDAAIQQMVISKADHGHTNHHHGDL